MQIRKYIYSKDKPIGVGWYRCVFKHRTNDLYVIKVAHRHLDGRMNRMEWDIWNNASNDIKKWLVPCLQISDCGCYMVCKKGKPLRDVPLDFPGSIMKLIPDSNYSKNWVSINDIPLLADYAQVKAYIEIIGGNYDKLKTECKKLVL